MPIDQGLNMAAIILLTMVMLALLAALPRWPYSRGWGYRPMAAIGALLVILVFLLITGVW